MAMNKYMHPRNIYKEPPDFAKLAANYKEFSNVVKMDVNGKASVDFKNPLSLRLLTKYLLKSDFNLDVEIPVDRLVPTLPLRLNYILWIEDILNIINKSKSIVGVDIGTGACAIYPLLAAVKNKWHMVATESDLESYTKAQNNVERNNLQDLITLKHNTTATVIEHLLASDCDQVYDFCMCNPPFYSNVQELCESRSMARPQPKNAFTGSPQELITEGGELEFIRNLISESKAFKHRIHIYTTMVGHKYNLMELLQDLKSENIHHTHTEFCQGRVTRWGLSWTYQDYDLSKLIPPRGKLRKKPTLITYNLPPIEGVSTYNIDFVATKFKSILEDLKIIHKVHNKRGNNLTMNIIARENTWSNQRRKRRLLKRIESEMCKKIKMNDGDNTISNLDVKGDFSFNKDTGTSSGSDVLDSSNIASTVTVGKDNNNVTCAEHGPVINGSVNIFKKDNDFVLEMEFLNGSSGKEGLHQVGQYIKNHWK